MAGDYDPVGLLKMMLMTTREYRHESRLTETLATLNDKYANENTTERRIIDRQISILSTRDSLGFPFRRKLGAHSSRLRVS
jgi:hypothetical protein